MLSLLFGLGVFWLLTALSLEWLLQGLLALLSGSFMPLWFFPDALLPLLRYLPFAWVGFYPVAVYLGKLAPAQVCSHLALGSGWAVILTLLVLAVWRQATRRINVQGG